MTRPRDLGSGIELLPTRTPTLPPATHTNVYLIGTREALLVEPAPEDDQERANLASWVRSARSRGRIVVAALITHHHRDHVGAAAFVRDTLELPLWAHETTAKRVDVPIDRFLVEGDVLTLDGPIAHRWNVLHTPGHAPGHVCLHEPEVGALLLGDMIATEGTILIAPGDGDMSLYLPQLERLASLDARVGLPAHGEPIDAPGEVLRKTHAHRLMREGKVLAALRRASIPSTVEALLPDAYDDTPVRTWPLARLSLLAHLAKLVAEGRAAQESETTWSTRS